MTNPIVHSVKRTATLPTGMVCYTAVIEYPDEPIYSYRLYGYPGQVDAPVIAEWDSAALLSGDTAQTFVRNPSRCGVFGAEWVRRFFHYDGMTGA